MGRRGGEALSKEENQVGRSKACLRWGVKKGSGVTKQQVSSQQKRGSIAPGHIIRPELEPSSLQGAERQS